VLVVLNGKLLGLSSTEIIVPYLHPTEAPFSTVHGAFDSLEYTIARSVFPLLVLGVIYLTAITVGRVFCGWACPLGLVQDVLSYLPFKKPKLSGSTHSQLKDVKWVVVGFSILIATLVGYRRVRNAQDDPAGAFSDSPFSVISPSATLFCYIPWMLIWKTNVLATAGMVAWVKLAILFASLVPSLYIPRFFCRYLCPLGALLQPVSPFKALRISRSPTSSKEDINRVLSDVCPMGVTVDQDDSDFIKHPSCIHCGKCVTEAPNVLSQSISFS